MEYPEIIKSLLSCFDTSYEDNFVLQTTKSERKQSYLENVEARIAKHAWFCQKQGTLCNVKLVKLNFTQTTPRSTPTEKLLFLLGMFNEHISCRYSNLGWFLYVYYPDNFHKKIYFSDLNHFLRPSVSLEIYRICIEKVWFDKITFYIPIKIRLWSTQIINYVVEKSVYYFSVFNFTGKNQLDFKTLNLKLFCVYVEMSKKVFWFPSALCITCLPCFHLDKRIKQTVLPISIISCKLMVH